MDFIKLVFGFLFFYRRFIYGALLLAALVYWLLHSKELIERFSKAPESTEQVDQQPEPPDEDGHVTKRVKRSDPDPKRDVEKKSGRLDGPYDATPEETATPEEIAEAILDINERWQSESTTVAYMLVAQKRRLSEKLMQMELTELQREVAKISYLESLSILDSLNVQGRINDENIRPKMIEEAQAFLKDPDEKVRSLASLVLAVYPGYDFVMDPSDENLTAFEQSFDRHFDATVTKTVNARKLAEVIVQVRKIAEWEDQTEPLINVALERFKTDTSEQGKETYLIFVEQLNFGVLELDTLVERMRREDPTTEVQIAKFRSSLEKLPDSRVEIYQIAMDIIREYIRLEQKDLATDMILQLKNEILPNVSDEEKKAKIQEAMEEFYPFL